MQEILVKKTRAEPGEASLEVTIPPDNVKAAEERATKVYQQRARLPGFRQGKAPAAVVAMTLAQAMAAAREAAWQEGRMLKVPEALQFHEVARFERDSRPVGFVTVGAPSPQLEKAMGYLRSKQGLYGR